MAPKDDALNKACKAFASLYPRMTPEAILAFMVIASEETVALRDLTNSLSLDEAALKQHLFLLATTDKGGLIAMSGPDSDRVVALSPFGKGVARRIDAAV